MERAEQSRAERERMLGLAAAEKVRLRKFESIDYLAPCSRVYRQWLAAQVRAGRSRLWGQSCWGERAGWPCSCDDA